MPVELNKIGPALQTLIPCPCCLGKMCDECRPWNLMGYVYLPGPPDDYLGDPDVNDVGAAWIDYRSGHRPVAGGMQDQSGAFADSITFFEAVRAYLEDLENAKVKAEQDRLAATAGKRPRGR